MNNILSTGGDGFLGKILHQALLSTGNSIQDIQDSYREFLDLSKPFALPGELEPNIIIHLAGKAHSVPRTLEEEKVFFDVNFEGTKNLCAAIDKLLQKPKAFIFISTVAVYGLDAGENITESHPLNGSTPYARSKILAEEFLTEWAEKNDITLGVLRLPLVAGPNPPGNLGAMIKGIKTGKYLSIGKANARKSIVWAEDIASIIPKLAEVGGIYNITDGHNASFGELEKAISTALNKKSPLSIPRWLADGIGKIGDILGDKAPVNTDKINKITSTLTFDDTKARQKLDWNPSSVLEKISEMILSHKTAN